MTGKIKLDETYIFKISIKCDSFDVAIGIKIPFFRVLVTIQPGCSLLQFVTTNCLIVAYLLENVRIPGLMGNINDTGFILCTLYVN